MADPAASPSVGPEARPAPPWSWADAGAVSVMFLATRFLVAALGYFANLRIEKFDPNGTWWENKLPHPLSVFFQWDAGWYLSIVRDGYSFRPGEKGNVAFFPLYPLLTRWLGWLIGDVITAGFIVSNLACWGAALLLYRLVLLESGDRALSRRAAWLLLIFPTSFYLLTYYTEALFLCCILGCLYACRRGRHVQAALWGGAACFTKELGIVLALPLGLHWLGLDWIRWRPRWSALRDFRWLLYGLLPAVLLGYMTFLWIRFGDPLAFSHAQAAWERKLVWPWVTILGGARYGLFERILYALFIAIALVGLAGAAARKVPMLYVAYALAMLLTTLSSNLLESSPRLIGIMFPVVWGWAALTRDELRERVVSLSFALLLALCTILFVSGYRMY